MNMRFQQGVPSKTWIVDVKNKENIVKDLSVVVMEDSGVTKAYPKVSYKGSKAILKFKNSVLGEARFEIVSGRSLAYSIFGGFK